MLKPWPSWSAMETISSWSSKILLFLGCPETARQKIMSILHHVSNQHQFPSFTLFNKCEHGDLGEERRPWINPGSLAMDKLRKAILGKSNRNLDDLKHMTGKYWNLYFWIKHDVCFPEYVHTGDIESLNNMQLKYANKTFSYGSVIIRRYIQCNYKYAYSWIGMIVRASLCALDWNSNVGRPHKLDEFGKPMYREKVWNLLFILDFSKII